MTEKFNFNILSAASCTHAQIYTNNDEVAVYMQLVVLSLVHTENCVQ